jgi:hypothetical protein
MAESNGIRELNVHELIKALENDSNAPVHRATKVFEYLCSNEALTDYDAVCFCIEFLAGKAAQMPWIEEPVRELVKKLYIMHTAKFKDIEWLDSISLKGTEKVR